MAADNYLVIGHFKYHDDIKAAIKKLREKGVEDLEAYVPYPDHDLEDEVYRGKPRSPVRRFTLIGGITGCLAAFLMTCWMSIDYPLRTGAKPLMSIPAFVVIAFECTILFAAILNILSMFAFARLPRLFVPPGFSPKFTDGTYGLTVRVEKEATEELKQQFINWGAGEVEVEYVR